ncbi:TfuA-like protein [Ruegeria sp.]|uniref:TfuA-like protein n=1 Tax=Ruegeria sp. TaxID=1879320 RepID=UPI003C7C2EBF
MTVIVFVGPTLSAKEVLRQLDATILPPVRQGDVYRAVQQQPRAIGIIDGFFEGVPSVWHKEILWAIKQGIPVYGSASMGALRAAELADFGMIGVGRIFRDYHDGTLQDDDEVAVLHSPAELGFKPLSEPMVSVRATVEQAVETGVLPKNTAAELLRVAKAMHYRQRTWKNICKALDGQPGLSEFSAWLPGGQVDAKAKDAREMLTQMAAQDAAGQINGAPTRVEPTLAWRELRARVDREPTPGQIGDLRIINELRLDPDRYAQFRDRALLGLLASEDARRRDHEPDRKALMHQMTLHRTHAGLPRHADLMRWLDENDLSSQDYESHLASRARVQAALTTRSEALSTPLLTELRQNGSYNALRDRAARKAKTLSEQAGTNGPSIDRLQVMIWYFETRLDQTVPDDLESYAVSLGLAGRDAFYELIEAEFLFCQSEGDL